MAITAAMIKELREVTGAGILDSKKALEASDGDLDKAIEHLREKGLAKAAKRASREANEGQVNLIVEGNKASIIQVNCETDFVARNEDFQSMVQDLLNQAHNSDAESAEDLLKAPDAKNANQTVEDGLKEAISRIGENIVIRRLDKFNLSNPGLIEGYIHFGGRVGVLVEIETETAVEDTATLSELAHDLALHVAATNPPYLAKEDIPQDRLEEERKIYLAQLEDDPKPDNIKVRIVEGRLNKFYKENCLLEQGFVKDEGQSVNNLIKQYSKKLDTSISISRFVRYELGIV